MTKFVSRICPLYMSDCVLTMVDHGQNTGNIGHGQTMADRF